MTSDEGLHIDIDRAEELAVLLQRFYMFLIPHKVNAIFYEWYKSLNICSVYKVASCCGLIRVDNNLLLRVPVTRVVDCRSF